uniref:Uncharacterized protein n=1 Tax=Noccaea caerulescens TaxID=107243 RepID=A0A1J3DCW2_NOCCA
MLMKLRACHMTSSQMWSTLDVQLETEKSPTLATTGDTAMMILWRMIRLGSILVIRYYRIIVGVRTLIFFQLRTSLTRSLVNKTHHHGMIFLGGSKMKNGLLQSPLILSALSYEIFCM